MGCTTLSVIGIFCCKYSGKVEHKESKMPKRIDMHPVLRRNCLGSEQNAVCGFVTEAVKHKG
jgi:hypothetical protein